MTEAIPQSTAEAAVHGSFCPKMCTFACPVTSATGRDDAVPWSFHRVVSDLAQRRLAPSPDVQARLTACTGCLACQTPCVFDQDVPEQVRAGRAAMVDAGVAHPAVAAAAEEIGAGRSPFGVARPGSSGSAGAPTVVVAGCRDDRDVVRAAVLLLSAAGVEVRVEVPDGCCGATPRDLGDTDMADTARSRLHDRINDAAQLIALDPHCLPELGPDARHVVVVLDELLEEGRLTLSGLDGPVAYHDPCLLARRDGTLDPPRRLLTRAGARLVEPEGSGHTTVCSGAGMAMELLDQDAARTTAERRAELLSATGVPAVTACSGARQRLSDAGIEIHDLLVLLAEQLEETP